MVNEIRGWTESSMPSRDLLFQSPQTRNERALPVSICGGSRTSSERCHSVGREDRKRRKNIKGKKYEIFESVSLHKYIKGNVKKCHYV